MRLGVSHKPHTPISWRVNISIDSDFQSAVLQHSKGASRFPWSCLHALGRTDTRGEGVALQSYAEPGKAERERRRCCRTSHTAGEWATLNTKPPDKPHPLGPACCRTLAFLKSAWDYHFHHFSVSNPQALL